MKKLSFFLMAMLFSVMSFAQEAWLLVTDASTLATEDEVVIVAKDYAVAMSTTQNNNNRGQVAITKDGNAVTINATTQVLTLKTGTKANTFALSTGAGYLYAASSSSNHLKTQGTVSDNSSWKITIAANGTATLVAQGTNTRNTMQYNQQSSLFSCYSGASQKAIALYKKTSTAGMVAAPTIAGTTTFTSTTTVTITAEEGLEVYYTLDGTDPVAKTSTKYSAPFELSETAAVKAIAYDAEADKASSITTTNFTKIPVVTCAEAAALAKDEIAVLNPFDVVYVVKGTGNIYVKDETGAFLIYDYDLDDKLKAGDHVDGFIGISSPYNGLPEMKVYDASNLTITSGTAPQPEVLAAAPTAADLNKYVTFNGKMSAAASFVTNDNKTEATIVVADTEVKLRNTFKVAQTFIKDATYTVVGGVGTYYSTLQVYPISATKLSLTISATANGGTVTGTGEFMEGDEVTLTAKANEGYEFVNWTWGQEEMCKNAEYTFTVEEDMNLIANFKKIVYTVTATAENGTIEGLAEEGKYEHGATATLTAKANEGYEFTCWTAGEDTVSTTAEYSFEVKANTTLVANFKKSVITITGDDCELEYTVEDDRALIITGTYLEQHSFELTLIGEIDLTAESFECDVQMMKIGEYGSVAWADEGTATVTIYPAAIEITATGLYDQAGDDPNTYNLEGVLAFPKSSAGGDDITVDGEFTVDMPSLTVTMDEILAFEATGQETGMGLGTVVTYLECDWEAEDGAYPVIPGASALNIPDQGLFGEVLAGSVVPVMDESIGAIVSATAVVYVAFEGMGTFKFTLNMTAGSSEEPGEPEESATVSVQVWNATLSEEYGTLMVNGSMNGLAVHAEVPGFEFVPDTWESFDYSNVMVEVGTWGESDYVGNAMGDATVELDKNTVTITGTMTTGNGTQFDVYIQGSLQPADPMTSTTLTMEGMTKTEGRRYIQLEDDNYNTIEIYSFEYGDYLKVTAGFDEPLEGYGSWKKVDGVETLVATLYDDYYTHVYYVTATVSTTQIFTLECMDATYTIDPELKIVKFIGTADDKDFVITIEPDTENGGLYSVGEWGETSILGTEVEFDDSDAESYYLGGTYVDDLGNTYEVSIFAAPAENNPTGLENNTNAVKATKAIRNGQLIIIKNGVRYNALGATVK